MRATASLLLLASAVMFVAAAVQRWWPACRRGAFETDACLRLQDHAFDHLLVADPWTPAGHAAQYAGVAMIVLAGAAVVLPFLLVRRPLWFAVTVAISTAGALTLLGAHAWTSGVGGQVQPTPGLTAAVLVLTFVVPVAAGIWATRERGAGPDPARDPWTLALAAALIVSSPLPTMLLGPVVVLYSSHDTSPWSDAVVSLPLVAAATLVWKVTPRGTPRAPAPPRRAGTLADVPG
ncbi:hypothetical protein [Cellulomonas dongxiuzhuiae]|uniref:DUF998 domain-containing protein n=1 Tax=Cellulomonas dongxiuzhuiae TaxID=2819979 RepID=A0ABX8GJG2_9CELL|nr:hypothetical protein [Cellulomonas dongxiuzhuiae]MBO3095024.1 hypothetical protein [Cellulomonas dongxiuzhuiae]QWC16040.1 hypothetical protein KKR89_17655 [Cellulomonas dongxiuzhuiae]